MQKILIVGLATLGFLSPQLASAQEAAFSNEQIMLNNQAVEATKAGNYPKAEQLFRAILQIGEFNVVWLNLGRAYASQDKCIEAFEAFGHVKTAPATSEVPVALVNSKVEEYIIELQGKCSAQVLFDCTPANIELTVDDSKPFVCQTTPISLTPGEHQVHARANFGINSMIFNALAGGPQTVVVEVVNFEKIATDAALTPEEQARRSVIYKAIGYSFIGLGGGALIGGSVLMPLTNATYNDKLKENREGTGCDKACISDAKDTAQKKLNISYGLIAAGGAMLVTGIVLVVVDAVKFSDKPKERSSFEFLPSPILSSEFQGLGIVGRF